MNAALRVRGPALADSDGYSNDRRLQMSRHRDHECQMIAVLGYAHVVGIPIERKIRRDFGVSDGVLGRLI